MLELEIDMADRVINQQQHNQDQVHDTQHVMNYQNLLVELQNQLQVNHHHNQEVLEKIKYNINKKINFMEFLPQRRCKEFAFGFPEILGG